MNDAGRIGFVIKGDYDSTVTYDFLDVVYFNNASYVAKKLTVGNPPQNNNEFWQVLVDGEIDFNEIVPTFTQAETRANINNGEKIPILFGKIKKFFTDLKTVAFTGSYTDLSNKPTASDIGAVATSKVLDTTELISANTASGNVAGALAVKEIAANLANNINDVSDDKLDKTIYLSNTSVNDIYETGIYRSNSWLDSPFTADGQGIMIVINYSGNVNSGWFMQLFISPHYNYFKIRKHASKNFGSWEQSIYESSANQKLLWTQVASFDGNYTVTTNDLSGYKEFLILYGLLYSTSVTHIIPASIFRGSGGAEMFTGDSVVQYISDTSVKVSDLPENYRLRIFAR